MTERPIHLICEECKSVHNSLFSELDSESLKTITCGKSCIKYKKGQTLFYEGTRPLGIYCVNTGKIKVFKMSSQGKEQIIKICQAGDLLGYRATLSEEFYSASSTVIEDATVCFIPKDDFLKVLNTNPTFYSKVVRQLCHELGLAREQVTDLAQKSVRERLAGNLLMLFKSYHAENDDDTMIDIALSREDLANIVGTATETVIRLLSDFKKEGLVDLQGKKIKILKPKELAREADFYGGV